MNTITDMLLSTQLCTCVAAALTYMANAISTGLILNPNWDFAVPFCLAIACFFMVLPYLITRGDAATMNEFIRRHKVMHQKLTMLDPEYSQDDI